MLFATPGEVSHAVNTINAAFTGSGLSTGCKIEVGLTMALTGLQELPPSALAEVLKGVIARLTGSGAPTAPLQPRVALGALTAPGVNDKWSRRVDNTPLCRLNCESLH